MKTLIRATLAFIIGIPLAYVLLLVLGFCYDDMRDYRQDRENLQSIHRVEVCIQQSDHSKSAKESCVILEQNRQ